MILEVHETLGLHQIRFHEPLNPKGLHPKPYNPKPQTLNPLP